MKENTNKNSSIKTFVIGIIMGTCDIIPGVSGGTIAFLGGIYDKLVNILANIGYTTLQHIYTGKWKELAKILDIKFLVVLFGGIGIGIASSAKIIHRGMETYPVAVRGFFLGLLLVSSFFVLQKRSKNTRNIGFCIMGTIIAGYITLSPIIHWEPTILSSFFVGSIGISAMILPGISGSYILLILNHYNFILENLLNSIGRGIFFTYESYTIYAFIAGAIIGLLAFSKLLRRLLAKYHEQMFGFLTGFLFASLHILRPRKEATSFYTNRHGEEVVLSYSKIRAPDDTSLYIGFISFAIGIIAMSIFRYVSSKHTE